MADTIPITDADLRAAIRDPRYWKDNPEREDFARWVSDGYKALYGPDSKASGGVVHVRAYTRKRDGHTENVRAHTRHGAEGGEKEGGDKTAPPPGEARPNLLEPAQFLPWIVAKPPFYVPPVRPPGSFMRRIPRISGKDEAKDIPSFAERFARMVGERAEDFATRIMNETFGRNGWRGNPLRESEWRKIKKWGERSFEDPGILGILGGPDEA